MAWRKITLYSSAAVLLVVGLFAVWLFTADLGVFKPRVERLLSDTAGREFSIDGELSVLLGGETVVIANDIRLANADWVDEPRMLDVGRLEVRFDLWSVFQGPLQIDLLHVSNGGIRLARSARGENNWDLGPGDSDEDEDLESGPGLLLRQVRIEDLQLVYESPERSGPVDLQIRQLSQRLDEEDFLALDLDASLSGRAVSAEGRVGSWDALLGQEDVEFDVTAKIDTLSLSAEGHIDDLSAPGRPGVTFEASGPDLNDIARLLGVDEAFDGGVDVAGSLAANDDGPLVLDIAGNVGQLDARATGRFSDLQNLEQASLEVDVSGPDLGRLLRFAGMPRIPETPYSIRLGAERSGPEVIVREARLAVADATLDATARLPAFPTPDGAEVQLSLSGDNFGRLRELLRLPGDAAGPYSLSLDVVEAADGVEDARLELRSSFLTATAAGRLSSDDAYVGSKVDFELETPNLAAIAELTGATSLPARPLSVAGSVALSSAGLESQNPVTLTSDDITAALEGIVILEPQLAGSDLTVELSAPDVSVVARQFAGIDGIPALPLSANGHLTANDGAWELQPLRADLGSSSVSVDGLIRAGDGLAGSSISVALEGPALEELTAALENIVVAPGPYSLSGEVDVRADAVHLENIDLSRQRGQITGSASLALPATEGVASFDLRGEGADLRSVTGMLYGFEPAPSRFTLQVRGNTRNSVLTLDTLDFGFGAASVKAAGQIDLDEVAASTRFTLGIRIPDLAAIGQFNGRRFNQQRFALNGNMRTRSGVLSIDDLRAVIGASDLRGTVFLESADTPHLSVSLTSDALRYSPLLEEPDYEAAPEYEDGRLIPDIALPLETMRAFTASIKLDIAELEREALRLTDVTLSSELRDGALDVQEFGFRAPKGWLRARGSLRAEGETGELRVRATARDLSIAIAGLNEDLSSTAHFDTSLTSSGRDLRTLVANLDGVAFLRVNDLTVTENRLFRRLYGDMLSEIVSTINPFAKSASRPRLECIVVPLEAAGGMLRTKPGLLIRSERVRIASQASINLQNEKIDMQFNTAPRKGISISAGELLNPYVKVTGTLARPRLAVDQQGVLISGGAAVATGGLSILAKAAWERLSRDADPCRTATDLGMQAIGNRLADLEAPRPG